MGWLTCSYQLLCLQLVVLFSVSCANLCSHDQSSALLHFKQLFSFVNHASSVDCGDSSYPKMEYWKEDGDCCSWDGVTCDMVTGHVIGLDLSCSWLCGTIPSNSSLFLLSHLEKLNLAYNDFKSSQIPPDIAHFSNLKHLNLSCSNFDGQVPFAISHLSELVSLDLGSSWFSTFRQTLNFLTLEKLVMQGIIQNLTKLEELNLDGVHMSTVPPGDFTNMSSSLALLSLDGCGLQGSFPENIFRLPHLHTLDLSLNHELKGSFPNVNWNNPLGHLDVSSTQFSGDLPNTIGNLKSLTYLGMESCNFIGSLPMSIGNLTQLSFLFLKENNFSGYIPVSLSNLEQLTSLDLSHNNFYGEIPNIFTNLTQLECLFLDENSLHGPIPSSIASGLQNLYFIGIRDNSLDGTIPSELFTLPSLAGLYLNNNQLTGPIPEFQTTTTSLEVIHLSNNRLHGPIPNSIFELVNLTYLFLASNNLGGNVELSTFGKLKKLSTLELSNNNISVSTKIRVNSSFLHAVGLSSCNINEFPKILSDDLHMLDLSNNKIHGDIPNWLCNISTLSHLNLSHNFLTHIDCIPLVSTIDLLVLDLSNNKIHGDIPNWLCNISTLFYLDLSHNFLTQLDCIPSVKYTLDLHSNLLQGQLLAPTPYLEFFSVMHNNMTGAIPSSFCNSSQIKYIELSDNSFNGVIPHCLGNSMTLTVLDLKSNNFHGSIPQMCANGSQLTTLNLNGNHLEGQLPPSLVNCSKLEVIDFGNNMINDIFPNWLAVLPKLQVLILRSNRFYGSLGNPKTRLAFPKLRILDLSHNVFTGYLGMKLFESFQAMMNGKNHSVELEYMGDQYYQDSVMVTMKGVETKLERILTIFSTIDLSSNEFQGQIPDVVGKLNSLKVLNFSHNNLTGYIPISLENLTELESLDLSSNKLHGEIPMQMTSLTSLSTLNLSYNQLEGPIPSGKQFNTFENNSYIGNLQLCGLPLSKKCTNDEAPKLGPTKFYEEHDTASWFDWKVIMMGYGSGLVIGLSMGYIVFSIGKPWWFVSMVEKKVLKLARRNRGRTKRRRN